MMEVAVVNKVVKGEGHDAQYEAVYGDVSRIIDAARESAARSVNAAMTAGYWLIGTASSSSSSRGKRGPSTGPRFSRDWLPI